MSGHDRFTIRRSRHRYPEDKGIASRSGAFATMWLLQSLRSVSFQDPLDGGDRLRDELLPAFLRDLGTGKGLPFAVVESGHIPLPLDFLPITRRDSQRETVLGGAICPGRFLVLGEKAGQQEAPKRTDRQEGHNDHDHNLPHLHPALLLWRLVARRKGQWRAQLPAAERSNSPAWAAARTVCQ